MKKAIIGAAIMAIMGTSLAVGTNAVIPQTDLNTQAIEIEENAEIQIVDTDVTLKMNSSESEDADKATEMTENVTEEVGEPEEESVCEYPEWQDYVVANAEGKLRVREDANTDSEIVGKMYENSVAEILEQGDEWTKIESGSVTGYVSNEFLLFGDDAGAYITENYEYCATVEVGSLNVREEQSTESECIGAVSGGKELTVISETEEWVEIQYTEDMVGYVSKEYVTIGWNYPVAISIEEEQAMIAATQAQQAAAQSDVPPVPTSAEGLALGQQIANYACRFTGNPYAAGGTSLTDGADCSGFVMSVYAQFGYSLPRTTSGQAASGTAVSLDAVQPGDIICYSGHVGIYIGGGQIVHASTENGGIRISNMSYSNFSPYGARRIVQ